eukprot:scaffold5741_cov203-Ochromonas_danica.AAC.3
MQKFSIKEQEVMFQAYVINVDVMTANFFRRQNKRHNLHPTSAPNAPNLSPSPSKSRILSRMAIILNRVAKCVSQTTEVWTRWQNRRECTAADLPSDSSAALEVCIVNNESNLEDYSSTVTGESRFLQSHRWEGHVSTAPIHKKSSLFSLSLDPVECEVRRHPASEYDKKGYQQISSTKYRIAPDSEYEAGEEYSEEGFTSPSSGKECVDGP